MSPQTLIKPTEEPALALELAARSEGQRTSLEVAEAARDGSAQASPGGDLFLGRFEFERLLPFPAQSDEERRIGDGLVAAVSRLLAKHLDPEQVDATRSIPEEVVAALKNLGIFRMKVPLEYGGLGLSQVNYNRVLMAIASHCGSTAVLVSAHQSIGVPQPLKLFGTEDQKRRYLRAIAEGRLSGFALTEPDVGSDPARMATTATLSADGRFYVLDGTKLWTTNGPIADLLVVMAQTAPRIVRGRAKRQITAFIVETAWPGVEVVHRCDFMGLRGIQNGLIRFDHVRVPAENVLWGEGLGLKLALRTLNTGRLTLPAACAGLGKQCLSIVRRWGQARVQWGHPIGRHEAGSTRIASIAASTFAMEAVTWLTSHWADEGRDIRIEAAMAKLFCSETAWQIADATMQFRGGRGYERATSLRQRGEAAYPVERMMRDCRINTIIEGTSDIMRLFLAREALDPHLRRAMELLRPGTPLRKRARAALGLAAFYGRWYPARVGRSSWARPHRALGSLATHARFIERASNRLARALIHAMVRHGQRLERRQVLLGRLMDAGTELFVMAAVCAYAHSMSSNEERGEQARALAEVFCASARRRVRQALRGVSPADQRALNRLAGDVLDGRYLWMEEGIIRCGEAPLRGAPGEPAEPNGEARGEVRHGRL
jgi:hypothetical protein